jgi:hypothetical protein
MPLLHYFAWVGGFLPAALFAANWCCSPPFAAAPRSDIPLNQKINIRIHSDHKWPEPVVFDTTRSKLASEATVDAAETNVPGRVLAGAENQAMDAFAEMTTTPARTLFSTALL